MPEVKAHKLGPGSLKLGATGSEIELAIGLREAAVEPDFKEDDSIPVLSGEELAGEAEESAKLTGKILQQYDLDSAIVWAQMNNGKQVPFTFRPDNDKDLGVKGIVTVRRLTIGGKVKERNESDIEWVIVGGKYDLIDGAGALITTWTGPAAAAPLEDSTPNWN